MVPYLLAYLLTAAAEGEEEQLEKLQLLKPLESTWIF
jgi:hypothetical protein